MHRGTLVVCDCHWGLRVLATSARALSLTSQPDGCQLDTQHHHYNQPGNPLAPVPMTQRRWDFVRFSCNVNRAMR